jgi:hypothetical protein
MVTATSVVTDGVVTYSAPQDSPGLAGMSPEDLLSQTVLTISPRRSVYAFTTSSCSGNLDDAATSWSDEDCHAVSSNDYQTFGIVRSDSVANSTANSNQTIEWVNA